MQKYHIKLTEKERQTIKKAISKKGTGQQGQKRGKILLDLDESSGSRQYTTKKIARRQGVSEVRYANDMKQEGSMQSWIAKPEPHRRYQQR